MTLPGAERLARFRTRLMLNALLWRCTYATRLSHKPLCARFRRDTLKLSRVYVCRSCFCVYASTAATLATCVSLILTRSPFFSVSTHERLFVFVLLGTLISSFPRVYRRLGRNLRDSARVGLGLSLGLLIPLPFRGRFLTPVVGVVILLAFWRFYFKLRAARRMKQCEGCPEYEDGDVKVCSGYAIHAEGARRYEELASAWMTRSGFSSKGIR